VGEGPIEPAQSRVAERRLLATLRRHLKRSPLRADVRVDTLVSETRGAEPGRASTHRGRQPLTLTDGELRAVVDGMVESGTLLRTGHRIRLPEGAAVLDPIMRGRVDALVETLAAASPAPPAAEAVARRLGIPAHLVDQLRVAGELVAVAPRIDYPRDSWIEISGRLGRLAADGPPSVKGVRDAFGTGRRHAEAILRHWNRVP
jgi:hypothetical protein